MMRKGVVLVLTLLAVLTLARPHFAQIRESSWSDGNPTFQFTYDLSGVKLNGVAGLIASTAQFSEPDTFSLSLSGIDKIYSRFDPASIIPEDFNRLPDIDLYLVTDAFNRRVFVIRPTDGVEVGQFQGNPGSPEALERPVAAKAFLANGTRKVLVTDQGSNRVLVFDYDTRLLEWSYGTGSPGSAPGELISPMDAVPIPDSSQVLICDTGNNRVLLIDMASGQILWSWGEGILRDPVDVEWTGSAILLTDRGHHRVILVQPYTGTILWQFGGSSNALTDSTLDVPVDAQWLPDSTVLIADAGNERLLQIDMQGRIVWRFLGRLKTLKSVYRLPDGKTLVVSDNQLKRLGYATETFISAVHDLDQPVNYDSLRWQLDQPPGTGARFQIRSANSLGDLAAAPWLGPTGASSYYTSPAQPINAAHDGHRFFQYRVELTTQDPLITPVLQQVTLHYHFYNTDRVGTLTSPVIRDSAGAVITQWKQLNFNTVLPGDPALRDDIQLEIRILNAEDNSLLQSFSASSTVSENQVVLSGIPQLRAVQAIRLQAVFLTSNSAISPLLKDWSIAWESARAQAASIRFTNEQGDPVRYVRTFSAADLQDEPPRAIFLSLLDANLPPVQSGVEVELTSRLSQDRERVTLELRPTGEYVLSPGLPAVIQEFVGENNGLMELSDRDTLVVRYADPTSPGDVATDSVVVIAYTMATLVIENARGDSIRSSAVGDTIFLRILGENDHDLSPAQDSLFATVFDNVTDDVEQVLLLEVQNAGDANYSTGEFVSPGGILLRRQPTGVDNDGILQTLPGHQIGARYSDNEELLVTIQVLPDSATRPPVTGPGAFQFLFGPNPYSASSGADFRLRVCAFTGDLELEKVEIYNLAGDRVRTLTADELRLDAGPSVAVGTCSVSNRWWDLRTQNGMLAASGTYWAKFTGAFRDASGRRSRISVLKKFVLVQ